MEKNSLDNLLKLIVRSSFVVFIGVVISKVFTYLFRIIVARYFGPEVYGTFSLSLVIFNIFVAVSSFGIAEGIIRYISFYRGKGENSKIPYIFRLSIFILFISSLLLGFVLYIFSSDISIILLKTTELGDFLKLFSFAIPIAVISSLFLSSLKAFEKINEFSFVVNILQNVVKVVFLITLIFYGIGSDSVVLSYVASFILVLIVSYVFCKKKIPSIFDKYIIKSNLKTKIRNDLFSYSWPLVFTGIIYSFFYWIDSFVIGYFMGASNVGFYNAAFPIVALIGFFPEIFMQLFFPLITKEYGSNNIQTVKELSKQVGKWIFILNIPVFLIMLIFPDHIIKILFGGEYVIASDALRILSIGGFVSSAIALYNNLFSMIGKSKIILVNMVIASISNLVLNIYLVPIYGINGAAAATTFVWIFLTVLTIIQVKRYTGIIPFKRSFIKIFLITIIPIIFIVFVRYIIVFNSVGFIVFVPIFIFFYYLLIFLSKCFDENDMRVLIAIRRKLLKGNLLKAFKE